MRKERPYGIVVYNNMAYAAVASVYLGGICSVLVYLNHRREQIEATEHSLDQLQREIQRKEKELEELRRKRATPQ